MAAILSSAQARITRLEVLRTEPAFGGQAFGTIGAYEHVTARAHGEVDPADPHNAIVQDLNLAPRNARGMVELTCGNGNANATLAHNWAGNLIRMESSQGNLTLNVPQAFRGRFDLTTAQGTVTNPLRTTPHAPLVFMLTEQGNVTISREAL